MNMTKCVRITNVSELKQEADFYCLSLDKYKNFFVTEQNILVHNEPISIAIATIGGFEVTLEIVLPFLLAAGGWLCNKLFGGSSAKPYGHDSLFHLKQMTNKQAREEALKLGFKEVKGRQHGGNGNKGPNKYDLLFERGPMLITPDRDQHGGSIWKLLDPITKKSIASLDAKL